MTENFLDITRPELEARCMSLGVARTHAKNLFRATYKAGLPRAWTLEGFPKVLRMNFDELFGDAQMSVQSEYESAYDGSVKFLVTLADHNKIEMVLMPESKRVTLCVSSQVGCAQGCTFCHTGRMGLIRNLSTAEIVGQLWLANQWISDHPAWLGKNRLPELQRVTNIVFMGMGEPLDNVEAVGRSISILTDVYGPNIALRRISVSTAGHLEGLERLLEIHPDVRLAISVHSPSSVERSRIMPINRRWPLEELLDRLRAKPNLQKNGLLLQYTLIAGVNDSLEAADKLLEITSGLNVKINLIPLNPVGPSRFRAPAVERIEAFRDRIYDAGIRVLVRYSKGQDIAAACGQLVNL